MKELLSAALKQPAEVRAGVLNAAAEDPSIRREVEELLSAHGQMGRFLAEPLLGDVPDDDPEAIPADLLTWSRYQVLERIGSGGMATVYKAWDPQLRRAIAIKVITAVDQRTVQRFVREAEAQARVEHDNVVKVYETGSIGPHHYIAMQFVQGRTLLAVRDETTVDHKVELIARIADGLHEAHRLGLVHRDIKPGNILVERTGATLKPYILDFGIAVDVDAPSLTQSGVIVGTPRYMAPERVAGGAASLDRRSDVYSLGATFYEFVSGVPPFGSAAGLQVLVDVLEGACPPLRTIQPTVAPELDTIISMCLERDPRRRYASARALAEDLRRYLDGDAIKARPTGPIGRLARKARRHPRLAAAFAVLAALTVTAASWAAYAYWRTTGEAALAQRFGEETQGLEWLYRAAQMSPLHPIEPERRQVRTRMARIEQEVRAGGTRAFGPGHYALGRGFLALGDAASALDHLQRAWTAGYREPDVAMALGLAHAEIFREQVARAQRIENDRQREARVRELDIAHRQPALAFLRDGRSSAIVPARYVDALIASQENDLARALRTADAAAAETPWLFEARLLAAHVHFTEAVRLYVRGDKQEAAQRADAADALYARAQAIAASAIEPHLGRCAVDGLMLHMIIHSLARNPEPFVQQADDSCRRALTVDPSSADANRLYAEALTSWGSISVMARNDPGDAYDRAATFAARAIAASQGDVEPRLAMADLFMDRAWLASREHADPRPAIDNATAAYQVALAAEPRNLSALDNIGQTQMLRYRYEASQGLDPRESESRAIATFEKELQIDPLSAGGFDKLARAAIERADDDARRGANAAAGLNDVLQFIERLPAADAPATRALAVQKLRARLEQ